MQRRPIIAVTLVLAAIVITTLYVSRRLSVDPLPEGTPTPPPQGEAWANLLDEEHAAAWENITDDLDIFEIEKGVLHIFGKTIHPLRYAGYTTEDFQDFDLHIEFKIAAGANSGIFLRAQPAGSIHRGFELQVLDDYGDPPHKNGSGAIYDVVTPMFNMSRPAGEWNSYDISVKGQEVIVIMNGWMVVHTNLGKMTMHIGKYKAPFAEMPREGSLTLQDHGGEAWYRNIFIKKHTPSDS